MEIAPSKDWGKPGKEFYVGLYARSSEAPDETVTFDNLKVMQKPTEDADDRKTGFKAVRREYNWSGFFGDAVVVSFDEDFEFHNTDQKFVFWSEMNYVPAWHMNDQLLFSYEFVESILVPQVMLYGFMGLKPKTDRLEINPNLPSDWPGFAITSIRWHGNLLDITVKNKIITVSVHKGDLESFKIVIPKTWDLVVERLVGQ